MQSPLGDHGRHPLSLSLGPRQPERAAFRTDDSDTLPSPFSLVAEIGSGPRLAYLPGKGNAAILSSMAPKSRRVRWLSANSNQ